MKIINKKNSLSAIISFIFLVIPISANCKAFADSSNLAINIITVNDFHGRIVGDYSGSKPTNDATWLYADEVSKLKSQNPDGTIFASAGDNISASLFASSIQQDNPTIDALNALNLDVSAVGNHEFDKGLDDLQNRVMKRANFPYLADNVYIKGTKTPYFPTDNLYKVITKQNIRIGFVGSVTQETPAAINPDHIKGVDFGDPVEAVNTQVAYLKNNNLADIIVALYHEGADCSDNPTDGSDYCPSIDDAKKRFPVFGEIVDKTSPDVATIVTAHTHKKYVWTDSKHNNRIVSQTGCYGQEVGNLTLNIDQTTKQLVSSSGEILAKHSFSTPIDSTEYNTYRTNSLASYPSVSQVAQISDDAQSYADAIGLTPIAGLTGNITRSLSGCQYIKDVYSCDMKQPSENRGDESSVGRMVANSYKDYVSAQLK
ncbi:MAG: hypothetical protein LBT85_01585, partial [Bifidobacteriaceae bacterium]|nr:hypothetical protein [Bifidobacteriaceae bacterium]